MSIEKALEKKFGKDVFFGADQLLEKDTVIVPIGPALDSILGGGIPMGSFVVITGKPKIGKSSLCLTFARNAQRMGFKTYYMSVESRLKKRDVQGTRGLKLDKDNFEIIGSTKGNLLYAEDYLDILLSYLEVKENSIFILDSVSQLCSKSRKANEMGDRFRDDVPLMLADMTKKVSNLLPVNNNILICITHLIANQGGMGKSQWNEASGQKVQYQADVKLKALYSEAYPKNAEKQVGQIVHWQCDTTALNAPPCQKTQSLLRYGEGIDAEYEILDIAISLGIVDKGGSWLTFPNGEKAQGMEKGRYYLVENPEVYNDIQSKIKEMLGT